MQCRSQLAEIAKVKNCLESCERLVLILIREDARRNSRRGRRATALSRQSGDVRGLEKGRGANSSVSATTTATTAGPKANGEEAFLTVLNAFFFLLSTKKDETFEVSRCRFRLDFFSDVSQFHLYGINFRWKLS